MTNMNDNIAIMMINNYNTKNNINESDNNNTYSNNNS